MAIKVQEVKLSIVYDDAFILGAPAEFDWKTSLRVGGTNVGCLFAVAKVAAADVKDASSSEICEFNER